MVHTSQSATDPVSSAILPLSGGKSTSAGTQLLVMKDQKKTA
jgi:hypothetical protein